MARLSKTEDVMEFTENKVIRRVWDCDARIQAAIDQFPETFGLRAFPEHTFRLSPSKSYIDNTGRVTLYAQIKIRGEWLDHSKGTPQEFKREMLSE